MKDYHLSITTGISGDNSIYKRIYYLTRGRETDSDQETYSLMSNDYINNNQFKYGSRKTIATKLNPFEKNINGKSIKQELSELVLTYDKSLFNHSKHKNINSSRRVITKELLAIYSSNKMRIVF